MQRTFTLAFALALIVGAPPVAASQGLGPAVSATRPQHHSHWIEIASFQFGVGRAVNTPTNGASDREGSASIIREVNVHANNGRIGAVHGWNLKTNQR
jgi:hypothetical protein